MWGWATLSHLFLLFPRHPNFGRGKEGAIPNPKYWKRGALTIDVSCLYFKKYIFPEIAELEWQRFQDKKEDSFVKNARMHTI